MGEIDREGPANVTCRCHRSAEACWRAATTTGAFGVPLCKVCEVGCGELRFVPLDGLEFLSRLVAAHTPMIMEYQP